MYSFLHLTFEEYFTAREIARLWTQGRFKLTPYLHRPRREEPVLLAAAHLSDGDDERHADALCARSSLSAEKRYEEILHRDLLLAARCLADDVVVSRDVSTRVFDGLDRDIHDVDHSTERSDRDGARRHGKGAVREHSDGYSAEENTG